MKLRHAKSNTLGKRNMNFRRVVATLVAATAGGTGLLAATAGTAHAATSSQYSTLVPSSDWLNVAVAGGSTAPGAPIIQWWATGGAEQEWALPTSYTTGEIINQNSGMCVTTDGVAGDQLYQEPCSNGAASQQWYAAHNTDGPTLFQNPATGLVMDVSGYDMWAGGQIDAWYPNGQANQYFWNSTDY
jgi:hypothetical protein